jgi:hypothetical protein
MPRTHGNPTSKSKSNELRVFASVLVIVNATVNPAKSVAADVADRCNVTIAVPLVPAAPVMSRNAPCLKLDPSTPADADVVARKPSSTGNSTVETVPVAVCRKIGMNNPSLRLSSRGNAEAVDATPA